MSCSVKNRPNNKHADGLGQFPDRTAYRSVADYNADVKAYWKDIAMYRALASEFHRDIMKGDRRAALGGKDSSDAKLRK